MFLVKGVLKLCSKFTGEQPSRTPFQDIFYYEHLWMDASEYQGRKKKYFQLLFLAIKVENLDESCQNIDSAMK